MNDFNEKPITAEVRELVLRIMERAMFYNSTSTEQKITGNKPTFFVKFSGHIATLEVDIHTSGWNSQCNSEEFAIRLVEVGYNGTPDDIRSKLESVIKRMEEVYDVWHEKENTNE